MALSRACAFLRVSLCWHITGLLHVTTRPTNKFGSFPTESRSALINIRGYSPMIAVIVCKWVFLWSLCSSANAHGNHKLELIILVFVCWMKYEQWLLDRFQFLEVLTINFNHFECCSEIVRLMKWLLSLAVTSCKIIRCLY